MKNRKACAHLVRRSEGTLPSTYQVQTRLVHAFNFESKGTLPSTYQVQMRLVHAFNFESEGILPIKFRHNTVKPEQS